MAQIKVYGLKEILCDITFKEELSSTIHSCLVEALKLPEDKRFQRFISLNEEDFIFPKDRTHKYTIIEISMFEGRTMEAKKKLIALLYKKLTNIGYEHNDIEITIFETPRHNWGIRGVAGDEIVLTYKTDV